MSSYPFIGPCPSCGGFNIYRWIHSSCGGSISIDEYCDLICNNGCVKSFIVNWKFECGRHRGDPQRVSGFQLLDCISHVCRNAGVPDYIRRKMVNILNNY